MNTSCEINLAYLGASLGAPNLDHAIIRHTHASRPVRKERHGVNTARMPPGGALRLHLQSGATNFLFGADAGALAGVAYREYLAQGFTI